MLECISPIDNRIYVQRPYAEASEIESVLQSSRTAQLEWRELDVGARAGYLNTFVAEVQKDKVRLSEELAYQMGRPIAFAPGEINGFVERAEAMINLAGEMLQPIVPGKKEGFTRYVRREPLGILLTVAPWNYPFLTAVNSIVPALMAGNSVVLKHSHQTPLCAERLVEAAERAGLPKGLFQFLHLTRAQTADLIGSSLVDAVAFTGSVSGGVDVERAAVGQFIPLGLELGGKDPAYVRADVSIPFSAENLVEGAFFNSGQSCCGIERIYVHEDVFDQFIEAYVAETKKLKLGNPLDSTTTMGPVVRASAAEFVRGQTDEAVRDGAKALMDREAFKSPSDLGQYLAPQVLINVDHSMSIMREESFGPVVGIMKVSSDEEALRLMNDSPYGLTASIWSGDTHRSEQLAQHVQAGTVFVNRCDYLDPELAWTGIKNSGKGCTLSSIGYETLTRPKSFHIREQQG